MQEKISFNQISFVNEIKNALQRLETDTDAKLRSLMTAEANTNANTNANTCFVKSVKKFKDAVNICDTNKTAVSKDKFPEDVYVAVMQRVVAVEAPKIFGGEFNEGAIIKQLGAYISELLDTKTETITVGDKTYELSNPLGSTNSTVTVTVNGTKYIFSWNDEATRESFNSFMKSLAEFEKENLTAVFFAILKDVKKFSAS
ncbi:MAG: hypothetical protein IJG80_10720, partial [Selenomonadaceae bacterium]|nr:hypothetical protein [Selenomonadaceae bacterium]